MNSTFVEDIQGSVMSWLEEVHEPAGITDGSMEEEAQLKIKAWLEALEGTRQASEMVGELVTLNLHQTPPEI